MKLVALLLGLIPMAPAFAQQTLVQQKASSYDRLLQQKGTAVICVKSGNNEVE